MCSIQANHIVHTDEANMHSQADTTHWCCARCCCSITLDFHFLAISIISHTHTHTRSQFVSLCSLISLCFPSRCYVTSISHGMCAIRYVWDDKSFLFLLHKMQEFLVFIQSLSLLFCHCHCCCCFFRSTSTHTHITSHCVLNICKYLRCHDPKGDMIQMIYPENRKNYLNGCVAQHEALVRIRGAYRTNAPTKKFRLNSHKSFLNRATSALWLFVRFGSVWFGLVWFGLFYFCFLCGACIFLSASRQH